MNTGFGWRICCFFGMVGVFLSYLVCFGVLCVLLCEHAFCLTYFFSDIFGVFGVLCVLLGVLGFWFGVFGVLVGVLGVFWRTCFLFGVLGILVGIIGVFEIGILYLLHLEFELVNLMFSSPH